MPRGPRLDAPGTLHRVMVRGIERTVIFCGRRDRTDFLARRRPIPAARALCCGLACSALGLPAATVARALGVCGSAVLQAIPRGQAVAAARRGEVTALVGAVLGRGR